jgi:hypothetical protein
MYLNRNTVRLFAWIVFTLALIESAHEVAAFFALCLITSHLTAVTEKR